MGPAAPHSQSVSSAEQWDSVVVMGSPEEQHPAVCEPSPGGGEVGAGGEVGR